MNVVSPITRGVKSLVSKGMDKYTVRATGCMETSALARHGRSVLAALTTLRERSLQIVRNKSFETCRARCTMADCEALLMGYDREDDS